MRTLALAFVFALALVAPAAFAQVPVTPPVPIPTSPVPLEAPGPAPDEGGKQYALAFGCPDASPATACPARDSVRGEALTAPALAIDPADPDRVAFASLSGAAHDRVTLRVSTDSGRSYHAVALPEAGATGVALAAAPGTLLVAESTAAGVAVRKLAFDKAAEAGAPDTTLPASGAANLSATFANGTAVVAWGEGQETRVAWLAADGAWSVAPAACATPSNVAASRGVAVVACASPDAYERDQIPPGHLVVYALNLTARNLTLRGHSQLVGEPHLLVNETGWLLLSAFAYESPTRIHLRISVSHNGTSWFLPTDAGGRIHKLNAPQAVAARVLAMDYQPTTQTIHLIWSETPQVQNATDRRVVKTLVAMTSHGMVLHKHDLDVDTPRARVDGGAVTAPVMDDHDALLVHGSRELIAFGDDGALAHGELVEKIPFGSPIGLRPMPQPPQNVSATVTGLTNLPPPKFTLGFAIAGVTLAVCAVSRILYGRVVLRSASAPKKEGK